MTVLTSLSTPAASTSPRETPGDLVRRLFSGVAPMTHQELLASVTSGDLLASPATTNAALSQARAKTGPVRVSRIRRRS